MTTSRRLNSLPSDAGVIEAYLNRPWNPFYGPLPDQDAFSPQLIFKPEWPIGLFILAMLASEPHQPIPKHIRQGLPDVAEFHYQLPLSRLTQHLLQEDEGDIRIRGRATAEKRLENAERVSDNRDRARRILVAKASLERDGVHRWKAYLAAVLAIRRFASHSGIPSSALPDDPTSRLRPSQNNQFARRVLTSEEMDAVWKADQSFGESDLATLVLNFVRETNARRQSVIDLRLMDICWNESCVWLQTKGHRQHQQVISANLMGNIAFRALERRWNGMEGGDAYRPTPWGDKFGMRAFHHDDGSPLTDRWFDSLFAHIGGLVQLDDGKRFTLHYLRHTTIAQVERIAGYIPAQQFAGHRAGGSGETRGSATSIYVRWLLDDWKLLFRQLFPELPPGSVNVRDLAEKAKWLADHGLEY